MSATLRLISWLSQGFVILTLYRLSMFVVIKLHEEMATLWGEEFAKLAQPPFVVLAVSLFGVVVRIWLLWLSRVEQDL